MRLIGNILDIKQNRENGNKDIELHISRVNYITQKKDGRFFQPFEYEDELETPLVITGDRLARIDYKHQEEGDFEFKVYDLEAEEYVLNEDKQLSLTLTYDFDADLHILTSLYYEINISNEEFEQLKWERAQARKQQKKRGRR
ncbi:hypothetical protein ACFSKU_05465 [Pontibacter silvestris]|uniref:Uncharacterized protein n=1 Tax=Pontibacter silvestris TaxID=2305183 RepID=A0ABW4WU85_9BACT|nr:hypothetical protein [Pontibacter silvestris]MCC9136985.1 hypothetical protein [Pontibacter silvestris]